MNDWNNCKNILVIRADNMGDLLMSSPAIRALKEALHCKITLLTSAMGNLIAPFIKEIDNTIVAELPWVKIAKPVNEKDFKMLVERLHKLKFDAAVIFTVYSQNPLPAAMLAYMAGIPKRLAYCRENPYHLLTDWMIEKEPYSFIQHQVKRDLQLVKMIGAQTEDQRIKIIFSETVKKDVSEKLSAIGVDLKKDWLILHPGVSEIKREYPQSDWVETGKLLRDQLDFQLLITGSFAEKNLCGSIQRGIGRKSFSLAGFFSIEEFVTLVSLTALVVSVNTGTVHIAAATQTPVIVLYALTNPQHTPWRVNSKALFFSVKEDLRSKNEVVNYVSQHLMDKALKPPAPVQIVEEAEKLLNLKVRIQ